MSFLGHCFRNSYDSDFEMNVTNYNESRLLFKHEKRQGALVERRDFRDVRGVDDHAREHWWRNTHLLQSFEFVQPLICDA